jgi:hypothetical protein
MADKAHVNVRFSDKVEVEDEDEIREAKKVIQRRAAHDPAFGFAALHGFPRLIHVALLLCSLLFLPLASSPSRTTTSAPTAAESSAILTHPRPARQADVLQGINPRSGAPALEPWAQFAVKTMPLNPENPRSSRPDKTL